MNEENETVDEGMLFAESIFGFHTRKGLVKLSYGITFEKLISPGEARKFALSILEAAEAAETDEFIVNWLEKRIGLKGDEGKVQLLIDFREVREKMRRDEEIESRKE